MKSIEFTEEGAVRHRILIPENWDEMTASQVRYVFRQYERLSTREITEREFRILVLFHLMEIDASPSRKALFQPSIIENLTVLCKELDFLFAEDGAQSVPPLSFQSIQNALPSIRIRCRSFFGPAALCTDLTFGEFRNASLALNTFFKTENPADLDECIAHLYRPAALRPNEAGRKVKPVTAGTFDRDLKVISRIAPWKKNLIMLWFSSCIHYLQNETITVSGEEIDMKLLFSSSGDGNQGYQATWNDLMMQIARDGTIGTVSQVDDTPLMLVILLMWTNYKENKRNERQFEKIRKH